MPEISVIIPCFNCAQYVDRCLTSIVNQDIGFSHLQIICIDDASTDNTWECLQRWEQNYPESIILVHCEQNGRQGTARNIGMQYVNTPYVSFIDADDWIDADYYKVLYIPMQELNCDVVCCQYERDSSLEPVTQQYRGTGVSTRFLDVDTSEKRKYLICNRSMGYTSCCKLIKTELLLDNDIYFLENLAYQDSYWSSLLHLYAERIFFVEEKMYHYYVNAQSTIMKPNAAYHTDYITVYLRIWEEWQRRGFWSIYKDELEYDYLYSFYFGFLRITIVRFDIPSYSLFQLLRQLLIERVPDYRANPYFEEQFSEFHKLMFQPLLTPINKQEYYLLAQNARIYWAIQNRES